MVHKPKHKVHSFRGLLGNGGQDEINLERQNVNLAYRIVKFQIMGDDPQAFAQESVLKIYRESQSSIDGLIDFNDPDLLGAAVHKNYAGVDYNMSDSVIFDNTLFSRNIFVTHTDLGGGTRAGNYYIELEEVPVNAATLMQLKLGVARKLNLQQD